MADVIRNFLARYEQTREEEMSLEEYLDLCKRDKMAYAEYLAGMAFNNASLGYVHSMAH